MAEIHLTIENIRIAWQWSIDNLSHNEAAFHFIARSCESLFHFWDIRSHFQEGEATFAQAVAQLSSLLFPKSRASQDYQVERIQARLLSQQGWFAFHLGRSDAKQLLSKGLALLRLQQSALQAEADAQAELAKIEQELIFPLNYIGAMEYHWGNYTEARRYLLESLALCQRYEEARSQSIALNILGQIEIQCGNLQQAAQHCEEAIRLKRLVADQWGMVFSLANLGRIAFANADYAAALGYFEESKTLCEALGDQRGLAFALRNLADTHRQMGRNSDAIAHYQASLKIYRAIGSLREASGTEEKLKMLY